jgi:hypothetical protein
MYTNCVHLIQPLPIKIAYKRTEQDAHSMPRWDNLAKQRQAELCRQQRPWLKASGPRSDYGRLVSSRNAKKHRRRFQVAGCDTVQESETLVQALEEVPERHSNVTVKETRDIQIGVGDRALYVGCDPAIALICQGRTMEIFRVQQDLALCWVSGFPGLLSVPIGELQHV